MFGIFQGQTAREIQLQKFEREFPQARKEHKAGSTTQYDLDIQSANGFVPLRIFLPTKFPDDPPVLQLLGSVRHPWVNSYNQIAGHSFLMNWSSSFDLSVLVREVTVELARGSTPSPTTQTQTQTTIPQPSGVASPPPYDFVAPTSTASPSVVANQSTTASVGSKRPSELRTTSGESVTEQRRSTGAAAAAQKQKSYTFAPPVPDSFPELEHLDQPHLDRLLNDDVAFQKHFTDMDTVKNLRSMRDEVLRENARVAKENLEKQSAVDAAHSEVAVLRHELEQLKKEYDEKACEQLQKDARKFSPKIIIEALQDSANEVDDQSEEISSKFIDGDVQISEFVKTYMEMRKVYHRRNSAVEWSHRWLSN